MASAVIGALRVNLGLNSAAFRTGLNKSKMSVADFARTAKAAFIGLAAAAAGAFAAVVASARKADEMIKASRALGVPVEQLGRLTHAADLSGVAFSSLERGLRRTAQAIGKAMQGASDASTRAFDTINVSLVNADGTAREVNDVLADVADRFQDMPDGAQKTALAYEMFGRTGTEMINMLNQGSEGLAAMGDEAERLGLVFSERTAVASELFNDNVSRLSKSLTGLWNRVLANVIPAMSEFSSRIVEGVTEGGKFDGVITGISVALNVLIKALSFAFDHLKDLFDLFKVFVAAKIIVFLGSLAGGMLAFARAARTAGIVTAVVSRLMRAKITVVLLLAAAIAKLTGQYDNLVGFLGDMGQQILNALPPEVRKGVEDLGNEILGLGGIIEETDIDIASSLDAFIRGGERAADSFGDIAKSAKEAADGVDTAEDSAKSFAETVKSGFRQIGGAIRGLIEGTASWNDVLISVVQTLGQVALQQVSLAFGGGGGGGFIGDLLGAFVGGLTGNRDGANFRVGGAGLPDSQLVAFKASPDEVVSVMTPQQQRDAERGEGGDGMVFQQTNSITIQTPDVRSFKASEGQIAARLAQITQRGARNL